MSDTVLRQARDHKGYSRERVAAQLDPPISSKTLERWEKRITPAPRWRLEQLAKVYGIDVKDLDGKVAA